MANPYVKQTWTDGSGGGTPISAARLGVIETGIFDAHYQAAARVFHNAAQSINASVTTTLAFNSERFDTESNAASTIHDTVTNNSRLTCRTPGIYQITGNVEWAGNSAGVRDVGIRLNGTTAIAYQRSTPGTSVSYQQEVSTLYQLAVNDYVELVVQQTTAGVVNVNSTGNQSPEFMMVKVA